VAPVTVLAGHISIAHDGVAVALIAGVTVVENERVVVSRRLLGDKFFPVVAVSAVVDLGVMFAFFEMTDKAAAFGHRDVFSLDNLRVAARALEIFSSFEVFEVNGVVEGDSFEHNLSFEKPFVVATGLETAVVADFSPGFGLEVQLGPIAAQHDQSFNFDAKFRCDPTAWRIVALAAFELPMRTFLPALEIGFHVVAGRAESTMRCELDSDDQEDDKNT